jgi:glycosyltransferase involved in cell wall biosynthesis
VQVSVVIPSYNRAHRLSDTIASVMRQNLADVEIVLVDDGSTDNTREAVVKYGSLVKYIYQPNAGVGAARNTGLRHATGEFVAFLDSDDRWREFKMAVQLAVLRACPEVGLAFSDFVVEKPDGGMVPNGASLWSGRDIDFPEMTRLELRRPAGIAPDAWPDDTLQCWAGPMYRQLLNELPILTSSVVVRRSALDSTTWFQERVVLFEDWEFFARVARRHPVAYVASATTVNVGHQDPGRISKCSALDRAECYLALLERVWLDDPEFLAQYGSAVRSAHGRALLAVCREALLAGQSELALSTIDFWRRGAFEERRAWGLLYAICTRFIGGPTLLRNVLRGRALSKLVSAGGHRRYAPVNPAA